MNSRNFTFESDSALRQRAEALVHQRGPRVPENLETLEPTDLKKLLHELDVHRIELEMQNEELRRDQVERTAARERYFDLYDLAPAGYVTVDQRGLMQEANLTFAKLLDMPRQTLLNMPFTQLILKADQDIYYRLRQKLVTSGPSQSCELRLLRSNGTILWARLEATSGQDATGAPFLRLMLLNQTARHKAEDALRVNLAKYQTLFDVLPVGVTITDAAGAIVENNRTAEKILGMTRVEPHRRQIDGPEWRIIRPDGSPMPADEFVSTRALKENRLIENVIMGLVRDHGDVTWITVTAAPIPLENHGVAIVYSDISNLRRIEASLRQAVDKADAANRAKSNFLGNMSHEIRTPLNGVIGMTALLLDTPLTLEQRRYTEAIASSGEALLTLINDILDFSKIEAGKLTLETLDYDLAHLLEDFSVLMAARAHAKGLELICYADPNVPVWLHGDPGRLRQVLANLVGNATKFTEQGEVVLHVSRITSDASGVLLRFAVRDTGIGIPHNKIALIFDKFTQADSSITRRFGGTGLGLAISRQLAGMMDGEIGATSMPGQGSEFWFTARFAFPDQPPAKLVHLPENLAGVRVLLVDDNGTNLEVLTQQMRSWKMEVTARMSGATALDALKAADQADSLFDLIILDMRMPVMDGATLGRAIQAERAWRHIPLVMLTSLGRPGDARWFAQMGFTAYLNKPVRPSELFETLLVVLSDPVSGSETRPITTRHSAREAIRHSQAPPRLTGHVLLAEDNAVNQQVARGILEKLGLTLAVAPDGAAALKAMTGARYDLILMDVEMPKMDGLEATRQIRKLPDGAEIPIIAMTAHAIRGARESCLAVGMSDYISKPIRPLDLAEVLARWLPHDSHRDDAPTAAPPANAARPEAKTLSAPVVFNRAHLQAAVMGDKDLIGEILDVFLQDIPPRLEDLKASLTSGDCRQIRFQAHAIKGAAGNLGADALEAIASKLEQKALAQDMGDMDDCLVCLETALEALKQEIAVWKCAE